MTLLYNKTKNTPIEQQTADDRGLIETFNKKVDFVDLETLKPLEDILLNKF